MKIGYSLLLREFVQADELDYGDCKDFQITCPACSEAVFKVGSAEDKRRYLSHYRNSKSNVSECELRVASMSRTAMDASNSESRGQTLELFQKCFLEATLKSMTPANEPGNEVESNLRKIIAKSNERPAFRAYMRTLGAELSRLIQTEEGMLKFLGDGSQYRSGIIADGEPYREGQSEFWITRQMGYAGDYARYLFAPGSLRTLYDAAGIGLFKIRGVIKRLGVIGENKDFFDDATRVLLYETNGRLASFLNECKRTVIIHEGIEIPTITVLNGIMNQCLRAALVEFPYVETAMNARQKK